MVWVVDGVSKLLARLAKDRAESVEKLLYEPRKEKARQTAPTFSTDSIL